MCVGHSAARTARQNPILIRGEERLSYGWYLVDKRHDFDDSVSPACSLPVSHGPMSDTPKVTGPASYFPSIEKTYGKPIKHWMDILQKAGPQKHMELVALLKSQHAIGHGHANAMVAVFLAK